MLNCHAKNEAKRGSHSGNILCEKFKQSTWPRKIWGLNTRTSLLLINYLKWLNRFTVSMEAYAYAKNQHHSSIWS